MVLIPTKHLCLVISLEWNLNMYPIGMKMVFFIILVQGKTTTYQIQTAGYIQVTISQLGSMNGSIDNLVARNPSTTWIPSTNYQTNGSWFCVDLKKYKLQPTYYTIRDSQSGGEFQLRNWIFEGSNDNSSFTTLREHIVDTTITSQGMTGRYCILSLFTCTCDWER